MVVLASVADVLRDPITALVVAVGLAVGVQFYLQRRGRLKKAVSYTLSVHDVLSIQPEGDLEVLYRGEVVEHPRVVVWTVANSGKSEITPNMMERPITLRLPGAASIVNAEIERTTPEELTPNLRVGTSEVALEPLVLNPDDEIRIKAMTAGDTSGLKVEARIAGVSALQKRDLDHTQERKARRERLVAAPLLIVLFALYLAWLILGH